MRPIIVSRASLPLALVAFLLLAFAAGCETTDDDDGDGSYVCGDGACEVNDGESEYNCRKDCADPQCGDGTCDAGETPSSCRADCEEPPVCRGDFPVDCQDGTGCWNPGTNCRSAVFTCGGARRCGDTANWAFCCGGQFVQCPSFAPYFCPQDGLCYAPGTVPPYCNVSACTLALGDC